MFRGDPAGTIRPRRGYDAAIPDGLWCAVGSVLDQQALGLRLPDQRRFVAFDGQQVAITSTSRCWPTSSVNAAASSASLSISASRHGAGNSEAKYGERPRHVSETAEGRDISGELLSSIPASKGGAVLRPGAPRYDREAEKLTKKAVENPCRQNSAVPLPRPARKDRPATVAMRPVTSAKDLVAPASAESRRRKSPLQRAASDERPLSWKGGAFT
jgi:hypothetical protein